MKTIIKFIAILLLLVILGTALSARAKWYKTVSVKNNVIRTGNLAVSVSPTESWLQSERIMPGAEITNTFAIRNEGLAPARVLMTAKKSAGYTTVFNAIEVSITNQASGDIKFTGTLDQLVDVILCEQIEPNVETGFTITAQLRDDAPSEVADSYTDISFDLFIEQI